MSAKLTIELSNSHCFVFKTNLNLFLNILKNVPG